MKRLLPIFSLLFFVSVFPTVSLAQNCPNGICPVIRATFQDIRQTTANAVYNVGSLIAPPQFVQAQTLTMSSQPCSFPDPSQVAAVHPVTNQPLNIQSQPQSQVVVGSSETVPMRMVYTGPIFTGTLVQNLRTRFQTWNANRFHLFNFGCGN